MTRISVCCVTFNSARTLRRTLEGAAKFADEIVVVDSFSTDGTLEIAREFTDKVFSREYKYHGLQMNHAIGLCSHDWVFCIDSDEYPDGEMIAHLLRLKEAGIEGKEAFRLRRQWFFFDKPVHAFYPVSSPDTIIRFFHRATVRFNESPVHDKPVGFRDFAWLEGTLLHDAIASLHQLFDKANKYTSRHAEGYSSSAPRTTLRTILLNPVGAFFKWYLFKKNFLDGYYGFLLAAYAALYTFLKHVKLYQIKRSGAASCSVSRGPAASMKNFLIRILYRLVRGGGKRKGSAHPTRRRFLVVSATGVGDTLWGTPALGELRDAFPEAYIGVLTSPPGSEILKGNPAVDELFVFRKGAAGLLSLLSLLRTIRKKAFDTVFIFHSSDRILPLLSLLTGAAEIIGVEGQNKGLDFILTRTVPPDPSLHAVEARFAQLRCAGASPSPRPLFLALEEGEEEAAVLFLKNHGVNGGSLLIGLHPGAQKSYKRWSPRHFITMGNLLTEKLGCRIVVTGDSAEKELADTVAAGIRGAVSAAGGFSLRETAALIGRMDVFITNDTGPMHVAFALDTPVVALFCPTDPRVCGPYRVEKCVVIEKAKTCTPCTGKKCHCPVCMDQISPEEVASAAARLARGSDTAAR